MGEHCKIDVLHDFYCVTHKRHVNECRGVLEAAVIDAAKDHCQGACALPHAALDEALAALEGLYRAVEPPAQPEGRRP